MTNIKYLKENNLYEAHQHFMQLCENYPFEMDEAGEDDPNAQQDPNMMGGAPNAMGGDPMGGGAPGGDPNAMGGDPNMMGGDPNAMGGQDMGADPNAMDSQCQMHLTLWVMIWVEKTHLLTKELVIWVMMKPLTAKLSTLMV